MSRNTSGSIWCKTMQKKMPKLNFEHCLQPYGSLPSPRIWTLGTPSSACDISRHFHHFLSTGYATCVKSSVSSKGNHFWFGRFCKKKCVMRVSNPRPFWRILDRVRLPRSAFFELFLFCHFFVFFFFFFKNFNFSLRGPKIFNVTGIEL